MQEHKEQQKDLREETQEKLRDNTQEKLPDNTQEKTEEPGYVEEPRRDNAFINFCDVGMDNELNAIPESAGERLGYCRESHSESLGKNQETGHRIQESH
ncbi:hypothetical protein FO519_006217 [Halicephalobus sp. NKZ332]|nr:hypothetical protein FO519_006217 [Halicephalobus sp. NKZ332]